MADGSIAVVCTGGLSMVFALAAALPAFCFNGAACDLDSQHHSNLLRLAFAQAGTTMVGSGLDHAAGIWIGRNSCCNCWFASDQGISDTTKFSGTGRVSGVAPR